MITVKGLYRHAIKGLSADELDSVTFQAMESFPDDRRFALLLNQNKEKFDPSKPEWIHKSNFLCAFSAPKLMAKYKSHYRLQIIETTTTTRDGISMENGKASYSLALTNDEIVIANSNDSSTTTTTTTSSSGNTITTTSKRLLTLYERETNKMVLDSIDLATEQGRNKLAQFFSNISGEDLSCVTADNFQFGNTSSGIKAKGNSRTIHVVNAATVREVSKAIGIKLNPTRFRPNIVIDGLEPWEEFNWVGKNSIRFVGSSDKKSDTSDDNITTSNPRMDVIQRTVRCDGISVDPMLYPNDVLDIPKLLVKHFPQHGPYLGVYCHIEEGGTITLGDSVHVLPVST